MAQSSARSIAVILILATACTAASADSFFQFFVTPNFSEVDINTVVNVDVHLLEITDGSPSILIQDGGLWGSEFTLALQFAGGDASASITAATANDAYFGAGKTDFLPETAPFGSSVQVTILSDATLPSPAATELDDNTYGVLLGSFEITVGPGLGSIFFGIDGPTHGSFTYEATDITPDVGGFFISVIPEPGTLLLIAAGTVLIAAPLRRRRTR